MLSHAVRSTKTKSQQAAQVIQSAPADEGHMQPGQQRRAHVCEGPLQDLRGHMCRQAVPHTVRGTCGRVTRVTGVLDMTQDP